MEKTFKITVDGRQYIVTVEDISDSNSIIYPDTGSMKVPEAAPAASATPSQAVSQPAALAAAGADDKVSPLAGVVSTIDVSVGQQVNEGDQIASIEAMKMKTPIVAHKSGTVSDIKVNVGDAVDAGQPLLTIS